VPQRRPPQGGNSSEFLETIKRELNLSAGQMREAEAAVAQMRQSLFALASSDGDANARRERFREARQELEQRIRNILTPAQKPAFEEIVKRNADSRDARATQSGRVFIVGRDGKPQGVTVRIGATDGVSAEVVAGLDADAEVIIGGGTRPGATRAPRFGF
jgi:HlyD family secretion protein